MNDKDRFKLIIISFILFFIFNLNIFHTLFINIFQILFGFDKINTIIDDNNNINIFGKIILSFIFSILIIILL
jgi:hypothetical protein|tara:strand:- start:15069 stop:15287 length:219 start_codon:yes stop_codon:yes gene_type:complete